MYTYKNCHISLGDSWTTPPPAPVWLAIKNNIHNQDLLSPYYVADTLLTHLIISLCLDSIFSK